MDLHHLPNFPAETGKSIVQPVFAVKGNMAAYPQWVLKYWQGRVIEERQFWSCLI
jgi:hypothetical protein